MIGTKNRKIPSFSEGNTELPLDIFQKYRIKFEYSITKGLKGIKKSINKGMKTLFILSSIES
tara:strand:+ start:26648 stop:26833 length:186 start_codon:yes stop_codon:yes gene_type:complete